jgi:hypothetical protein
MRRKIGIGVVSVFLAATAAFAQGTTKAPAYHPKNEVTLTGKVSHLQTIPDWMGKDGVNLSLEGPEAAVLAAHVDVSTAAFLKEFEFPIAAGDELKLTGCWGESEDGSPVFLVRELTKKRVTLNLRDPQGRPLW